MNLLGGGVRGGGGGCPSLGQRGAGGVLFCMIKQKNIRKEMRYSNLSNNLMIQQLRCEQYNSNTVLVNNNSIIQALGLATTSALLQWYTTWLLVKNVNHTADIQFFCDIPLRRQEA